MVNKYNGASMKTKAKEKKLNEKLIIELFLHTRHSFAEVVSHFCIHQANSLNAGALPTDYYLLCLFFLSPISI